MIPPLLSKPKQTLKVRFYWSLRCYRSQSRLLKWNFNDPSESIFYRSVVLLMTDVLQGAVLQPILDLLPDPNLCVNFLIALSFDPEPSRKFPPPSGKAVTLLEHFVSAHQESRQSVRTHVETEPEKLKGYTLESAQCDHFGPDQEW